MQGNYVEVLPENSNNTSADAAEPADVTPMIENSVTASDAKARKSTDDSEKKTQSGGKRYEEIPSQTSSSAPSSAAAKPAAGRATGGSAPKNSATRIGVWATNLAIYVGCFYSLTGLTLLLYGISG